MRNQKKEKILVKAKSLRRGEQKFIKNLLIVFFLCFACLVQTIATAHEDSGEAEFSQKKRPELSEVCQSLVEQMRELRKQAKAKREELMASGEKPKLEMGDDGKPIRPPELLEMRQNRASLREQMKENDCPKPLGKKRQGKRGAKRKGGMGDGPQESEASSLPEE